MEVILCGVLSLFDGKDYNQPKERKCFPAGYGLGFFVNV